VEDLIVQTVWIEEKWEDSVSSSVSTLALDRISEHVTGTDEDDTDINSRSVVFLCCENSLVLYLYMENDGKMSLFG
jgi:hypothetical protein